MSILTQQKDLEAFSDQMLAQESTQPSGQYPLYLVAAEIQRRADLRERFANQQKMGQAVQPSVIEQRIAQMMQSGIGGAPGLGAPPGGQQMPPQMAGGIMQGQGGPPPGPPQGFQTGGRVERRWTYQDPAAYDPAAGLQYDTVSQFASTDMGPLDAAGNPIYPPATDTVTMPGRDTVAENPEGRQSFIDRIRALDLVPFWESDQYKGLPFVGDKVPVFSEQSPYMQGIDETFEEAGIPWSPWFTPKAQSNLRESFMNTFGDRSMLGPVAAEEREQPVGTDEVPPPTNEEVVDPRREAALARYREMFEAIDPTLGMELMEDVEADIEAMRAARTEGEARIGELEAAQRERVMDLANSLDAQSAVEKALAGQQMSPDQLAEERRMRALGQLAGLIGSARQVGDVGRGYGAINEGLYQMEQEQRTRQENIQMALASAKDDRDLRKRQLLVQQGQTDIASAVGALDRAQQLASTAIIGRSQAGNAAANLIDAMSRAQAGLLSLSGEGQMDTESLSQMLGALRESRATWAELAMSATDPAEKAAFANMAYLLDQASQKVIQSMVPGVQGFEGSNLEEEIRRAGQNMGGS